MRDFLTVAGTLHTQAQDNKRAWRSGGTREMTRHNAVSGAFIVFGLGARATRRTDLRCDRVWGCRYKHDGDRGRAKSRAKCGTRDPRCVLGVFIHIRHRTRAN